MKTINLKFLFGSFLFLFLLCSCKNDAKADTNTTTSKTSTTADTEKSGQAFIKDDGSTPNVLQIAIGSPDHTTLVAAVQAASLENVLVNAGPLMVFAPTNAAFEALPEGTVEDLLKPENKATLANILKQNETTTTLNWMYVYLQESRCPEMSRSTHVEPFICWRTAPR